MLNAGRFHIRLIILVTLVVLFGCSEKRIVPVVKLVAVPPPYPQVLVLENDSAEKVTVLPTTGSQAQPLVIEPGESAEIEFTVERLAVPDNSDTPIETTWTAEIKEDNPYIRMMDADGVLNVETSGGEEWSYRIALGTCWFENNPPTEEHEIIVNDEEPVFGVPALRLCE